MPEVIEVLKYADFIRGKLKDKNITEIHVLNGRYHHHGVFEGFEALKKALPLKVKDVETKGKFLYIELEGDIWLLSTLGLSGGWVWHKGHDSKDSQDSYEFPKIVKHLDTAAYEANVLKHLNVEFKTATGSLFFYDVLSFGTLKAITDKADLEKKLHTIGPDMSTITLEEFKTQLKSAKPAKPIGTVLTDQHLISGIGNYLRADVLWLCRISPFRHMSAITGPEYKKLWEATRFLIWAKYDYNSGLKSGAIPQRHPKLPDDYEREFYVYMQTTDPQGRRVKKEELYDGTQKRSIHWVPSVQK